MNRTTAVQFVLRQAQDERLGWDVRNRDRRTTRLAFWTYILRCADGSYYTGHTDNLETRLSQHQSGFYGGYTCDRRPVQLAWSEYFNTRDEALAAERQIKGWSRAKKEALIARDWERLSDLARNRGAVHPSTSSGRTG